MSHIMNHSHNNNNNHKKGRVHEESWLDFHRRHHSQAYHYSCHNERLVTDISTLGVRDDQLVSFWHGNNNNQKKTKKNPGHHRRTSSSSSTSSSTSSPFSFSILWSYTSSSSSSSSNKSRHCQTNSRNVPQPQQQQQQVSQSPRSQPLHRKTSERFVLCVNNLAWCCKESVQHNVLWSDQGMPASCSFYFGYIILCSIISVCS